MNSLIIESLKDDIPAWQSKLISAMHGKNILNNNIRKSNFIKDAKIKILDAEKNSVLEAIFGYKFETVAKEFNTFISDIKNTVGIKDFNFWFKASMVNDIYKNLSPINPWIYDIYILGKNIALYNISVKASEESKKIVLSKNQIVGFSTWIKSFSRLKKCKIYDPFSTKSVNDIRSLIGEIGNDIDIKMLNAPMFLYVSGKPSDIISMSISKFYDSCQNIYSGIYKENVIGNVFEKSTKIAYLIFDTPFIDISGSEHPFTAVSRVVLRWSKNLGILYSSNIYPSRLSSVMKHILDKYGYGEREDIEHMEEDEYEDEDIDVRYPKGIDKKIPPQHIERLMPASIKRCNFCGSVDWRRNMLLCSMCAEYICTHDYVTCRSCGGVLCKDCGDENDENMCYDCNSLK